MMNASQTRVDVVHVTTVHEALDTRIFFREARSAQKAGLRVAVIGPHHTRECVDGVQVVPLRKYDRRWLRRILSPICAVYAVGRMRARVVHFHDPEFIPGAMLLKVFGYRVVWDVHEYYSEVQTAHIQNWLFRQFMRRGINLLVERGPCAVFDRSVFPTHSLRAAISRSSRAIACVNLLPLEEFPDPGEEETGKLYDLIFVGSMSPFRAGPFMEMVRLLREVRPDFRAALLGVPESTRRWMLVNAPSSEVLNGIEFLPAFPMPKSRAFFGALGSASITTRWRGGSRSLFL